jgi:nucleotide-binding universal stress UspA family protein
MHMAEGTSESVNGRIGRIVVGVDGSPESIAALHWAAGTARLSHAEIVAVCAWHIDVASLASYAPVWRRPTRDAERRRAAASLDGALRTGLGLAPNVKVRPALVYGPPARVLVDQCADADLLVLGGHHADSPLVATVGVVAATCLRRASCPVVIVTAPPDPPGRAASPDADVAQASPVAANGGGRHEMETAPSGPPRAEDRVPMHAQQAAPMKMTLHV